MNDRLGDLGQSMPSWAVSGDGGGGGDIELGFTENVPSPANTQTNASAPTPSLWSSDSDDFDFKATSAEENVKEVEQQGYMETFFQDVEGIKDTIAGIETATRRIGEINQESMFTTSESKERELSMEVRPLIDQTNTKAKRTKTLLTVLKEENKKLARNDTLKNSDMRVRENLCNTLTRKFIDEMKLYQSAQQKFKTDLKAKGKRQHLNINPDATEEEIEDAFRSESGREGLFQQQILAGGVNDSIKQAYTKVSTKYQDVLLLEQSVAELHQMFLDFALLTEQQGELIDQIEYNVKSAADYVEDANVNVYQAIEYSKSIRKKQCCIIMMVVIITLIILFSIGVLP
jgi:t-SNARE complex subunit (syntaxin)